MNRRVIYFIYLLILISAIFYRAAQANPVKLNFKHINEIALNKVDKGTDIIIGLSSKIKPKSAFFALENSIVLDFYDTITGKDVLQSFSNENLKLGYVIGGGDKTRIKLFVKPENKISIVYSENDVVVRLRDKNFKKQKTKDEVRNRALVHPSEKKYSQAVLDLKDSLFESVVMELAAEAEIELQLGKEIPDRISARFETSTPFEALRNIAYENNLKFYRTGKVWYMAGT